MKKKNSGFTLVEVMISLAILSVLGVAIGSFLYMGVRQYHAAGSKMQLQTEAQMVQNQLQNLLIDANKGIYSKKEGETNPDTETEKYNALEIYNENADTGKQEKILISYDKDESALFYNRYYRKADGSGEETWEIDGDAKNELFARYVTDFTVDYSMKNAGETTETPEETAPPAKTEMSEGTAPPAKTGTPEKFEKLQKGAAIGTINIQISYKLGDWEYETDFTVTPRNAVIFSDDVIKLYGKNK